VFCHFFYFSLPHQIILYFIAFLLYRKHPSITTVST
jgi:hypothetical protein